jgi:hypothetical protein
MLWQASPMTWSGRRFAVALVVGMSGASGCALLPSDPEECFFDDDCSGVVDEGRWHLDADGDGHGAERGCRGAHGAHEIDLAHGRARVGSRARLLGLGPARGLRLLPLARSLGRRSDLAWLGRHAATSAVGRVE